MGALLEHQNCSSCNKEICSPLHPHSLLDISNRYSQGWKTYVVFVALRFGL